MSVHWPSHEDDGAASIEEQRGESNEERVTRESNEGREVFVSQEERERDALLDATPHYVHTGGKENDGQKHKSREQSGGHGTLEFDAATIAQHAAHERAEGARARRRTRDKRRATRRRQRDEEGDK